MTKNKNEDADSLVVPTGRRKEGVGKYREKETAQETKSEREVREE